MADHTLKINGFDGSSYRVGIVTAQFNEHITDPMLKHCFDTLVNEFKVSVDNIDSVRVPGAADAPAVLSAMAKTNKYDALIVMGAIVRGATAHFDYVSDLLTQGIKDVQVIYALPVAFGVIMCDTQQQAKDRIVLGQEFASAAMHTSKAIKNLA